MNFFEKLNLKFENYNEIDKNKEMIDTILKLDETLIFVNLKIDEEHKTLFGMNKISKKIREAFRYIQNENMKFINDTLKVNLEKINDLNNHINELTERINENKEINNYINNEIEMGIINRNENENQSLLNESFNEKGKLEEINDTFNDLITSIKMEKFYNAKESAEKLKKEYIDSIKKELIKYKIGAWISGIIPLGDIYIQYLIKKKAREKIADKFKDELIDLNNLEKKEKELSKEEKKDIDEIKDKSNDIVSDIIKSGVRIVTVGSNILAKTISFGVAGIGCVIGIFTGGLVMNYDINSYLEFYGKRLVCRLLVNLSFEKIENYLKKNFEQLEKNEEDNINQINNNDQKNIKKKD